MSQKNNPYAETANKVDHSVGVNIDVEDVMYEPEETETPEMTDEEHLTRLCEEKSLSQLSAFGPGSG